MKYLKTTIVAILVIGAVFTPIILVPRILTINEVVCFSQFGPCNEIISEGVKKAENKKLMDAKAELKRFLSANVLVSNYSMQLRLPDRLLVNIVARKPRYALKSPTSETVAIVGGDGRVIGTEKKSNLPTVEVAGTLPDVGEVVASDILFALDIVYDMYSAYSVSSGKIENESLVVEFKQGLEVIFPIEGERRVLTGSLVAILSRLNSEEEDFRIDDAKVSIIDLRFKNPVLR